MPRRLKTAGDGARARQVVMLVAGVLGLEISGILKGAGRQQRIARHLAFYIARSACGMSLTRVAYAFECDRSTVASACRRVEQRRDDRIFDAWLAALERSAAAAPPPDLMVIDVEAQA